jgi:hypothetical protein
MATNGTIYLIQPAELVGTNRYKIGCSAKNDLERPRKGYKKGSRFIYIMECSNPFEIENKIKERFNLIFTLVAGHEYFEGEENDIKKEFNDIITQNICNPVMILNDISKEEKEQEKIRLKEEKEQEKIRLKEEKEQEKIRLKEEKEQEKIRLKKEKEQEKIRLKEEKEQEKIQLHSMVISQSAGFKIMYYPCGMAVQQRFHDGSNIRNNHKKTCMSCKTITNKKTNYSSNNLFKQLAKPIIIRKNQFQRDL